jgi:uroporphyrinogen-III synthase
LENRRIALAESRELDLLAGMLEREGATVLRCPLVAIKDAPDAAPVEAWLKRVIAGSCDDIIFYTGEGLRRLLGFAERAGARQDFIAALTQARKITRGPKPVKALREAGLEPDLTAAAPTTDGLIESLSKENLKGRRIGLQIYGQDPNTQMVDFLTGQGAEVDIVAPYIYASEAEDAEVAACIRKMAGGEIDAIAFTSSPQIRRLEEVANATGLTAALQQAYARTKIAAIGPIVAAELEKRGIRADAMPESTFTMKPLVKSIARLLTP